MVVLHGKANIENIKWTASQILKEIIMKEGGKNGRMERY